MNTKIIELPAAGSMRKIASDTTARQVGEYMATLCRQLAASDNLTRAAAQFIRQAPERNFNRFIQSVYESVFFVPDPLKKQILRTPQASLRDGAGNCVDYTIFLGAVCHAAGLPVVIRLVKFKPDTDFVHVYPVINGVPVDLVIGQRQDGTEKTNRQNNFFDHFGEQVESFAFFDLII